MNLNDEMVEMMKFYEFYKKIKASEEKDKLTNKNSELFHKTEEAIHKSREVELNSDNKKVNSSNKTEGANTKDKKRLKKNHMATRPLDRNEYEEIIKLCNSGFKYIDKNTGKERTFRKNTSLAFAFVLQATLGFRASDIVNLKVRDFSRNKFSVQEIKTGKWQNREINDHMYQKILEYSIENNLDKDDYIYPNKIRNMQQQLKIITDYLGYKNIGTHSFRKLFAHTIYEESNHDIELVRHVLNHGDIRTTMRYLGVSQKRVKEVIDKIDFSYIL